MKARIYLRLAKNANGRHPFKVEANTSPWHAPLKKGDEHLPTVAFAIDIVLPDDAFKQAEQVIAEIKIPNDAFDVAGEVKVAR